MNTIKQEKIIKYIFSKHFSATETDEIMNDWKSNYKDKPIHLIQKMVFEHCTKAGIDVKANGIIKELLIEMNKEKSEKSLHATFHTFYTNLYDACPEESQEKILNSFLDNLSDMDKEDMNALTSYLNVSSYFGSDAINTFAVTESQMRNLISQFYQSMCSWLGPIEADNIFHQCITQLKQNGQSDMVEKLI